jgi:hypothetical protein
MNSFQGNGKVWILGAGASAFAGYPLATALLPFIRNFQSHDAMAMQIASRVRQKINDAEFQFCRHVVRNPNGNANLEELMTYLELYKTFPGTNFSINPWTEQDSDDVRRLITERFLYYQHDLRLAAWDHKAPVEPVTINLDVFNALREAWAMRVKVGDVLLSFNWDILHDMILWDAGLWSYKDGYGFKCGNQGVNELDSKVLLLKLHGSVNWVQNSENDRVTEVASVSDFFRDSKDWEPRSHTSQAQTDSGRKLILPTYLKDISSNRVLLDLWTQAHEILSCATELIVIGYSLNRVDHPSRLLFGTALGTNTNLDHVTVVAPDTNNWEDFLHQIGKATKKVRSTFEQWLGP